MTRIGVSIINFEAADETLRCIASLLETQPIAGRDFSLSIQVADNHSSEADYRQLAKGLTGLPGVALERHDANLGFAAGHNRNIERLLNDEHPDFIWLLNNDCEVDAHAPAALLQCAADRPEVGIWGATLLEGSGGPIQCAGGCRYWPWLSAFRQNGRGTPLGQLGDMPEARLDYVAGASLFMPVNTLVSGLAPARGRSGQQTGQWLNEEFFLYFEELDLSRRLSPGIQLGWCRQARIVHSGGAGTGSDSSGRSAKGEYHSTLSALKYTRLYHPGKLWVMAPARLLIKTLFSLVTLRFDLIRALMAAYGDFFGWLKAK